MLLDDANRTPLEKEVRALCDRRDFDGAATLALRGYGGEVLRFLLAVHRDEATAEDVFSGFAEGVWRSLPGFNWGSTLRTWAYAIARNVSRMQRRGAARRGRREELAGSEALVKVAQAVRTETLSFLRSEKVAKLEALRDALSPEERELLVLRIDRGLAWNDLARVLADGEGELDDAALQREAARLRKRFQVLKDRLRELAKRSGTTA